MRKENNEIGDFKPKILKKKQSLILSYEQGFDQKNIEKTGMVSRDEEKKKKKRVSTNGGLKVYKNVYKAPISLIKWTMEQITASQ